MNLMKMVTKHVLCNVNLTEFAHGTTEIATFLGRCFDFHNREFPQNVN